MERVKNLGEIGYPNYEVDDQGNVWSLNYHSTGERRKLKPGNIRGYLRVILCNNDGKQSFFVHRLVAHAFIPNPHNLPQVNHKDETKQNNVENLEWCDSKYNNNYGTRNERISKKKCKKVSQFTKSGLFIKSYNSVSEAAEITGIKQGGISHCLIGDYKSAGGFIWRYA